MIGGWNFDEGKGPISPSNKRAVGVVRICLEHFDVKQVMIAEICVHSCICATTQLN